MKQFDMFTGYGGFTIACQEYGIETIGFSEIDKYAIAVYKYHFPGVKNYGNARNVQSERLPEFDILTAGFPCQTFSIAGKRKGLEDTRGTLFYEIARIASVKRPKLLLLENVRGLLSHDNGRTFGLILSTLSELGYILQWQVLNSKDFGVPQNRERVFIIGHLGRECFKQIFPLGESNEALTKSKTRKSKVSSTRQGIQSLQRQTESSSRNSRKYRTFNENKNKLQQIGNIGSDSQSQRVYSTDGLSTSIASQAGGLGAKTGLYMVDMKAVYEKSTRGNPIKKGKNCPTLDHNCNLAVVPCIRAEHHNTADVHYIKQNGIRRLTPLECERLMGLPDNWTLWGVPPGDWHYPKDAATRISNTQRYKLCGNGIVVPVVKEIIKRLINERLDK